IKWTRELKNVPIISASHHEKMNGEGYPKGLTADQMPIQARMLAVADIFDALTAKDRPYKPAIPIPKTLQIIQEEADRYHLDPDLVDIFIREKAYELDKEADES
ncbi:phosphohydrolase, partial [Aduncisulcus paluster]